MKTDIEIAHGLSLKPIAEIARELNILDSCLIPYGKHVAKIPLECIDEAKVAQSNLILVTSITPTKAGIGKTTVSIGLALGLNKIGKQAVVALREPSLGPCFGIKGGAAGGGYAQVLPMEQINLHFTGDFHAITSAHNLISALLDNHNFQNQETDAAVTEILWKRVLDVNDRSLRHIMTSAGAMGQQEASGFDITAASEIMAIVCLATDIADLRRRIENILLGYRADGRPFTVADLGVAGAIVVLLKDALNPNIVQTTEQTLGVIHGGPFANIAHGCSSVIGTKMAMSFSDYVITEAGFGADLGAEKFFNIKCRHTGLTPKLTVIVVTAQALKMHGGVALENIRTPNLAGIAHGLNNLSKHVYNIQAFGQEVVVAFNHFAEDTAEEVALVEGFCHDKGIGFALNNAFAEGGAGAKALAQLVVQTIEHRPSRPLVLTYVSDDAIEEKITQVAQKVYGAASVSFAPEALAKLARIKATPMAKFPVCIAKTQYSFSQDPCAYGVCTGFNLTITDLVINRGAEFIVALAGSVMRMPGLPKAPQATQIDYVDGAIVGLS